MSIVQTTFISRLTRKISDSFFDTGDLIEEINASILKFCAQYNIPYFRKKSTWTSVSGTSTHVMTTELPDLFGEKIIFMYNQSYGPIKFVDGDDYLLNNYSTKTTGNPERAWWATYQTLETDKKFSSADTIYTTYYRKHTTVTTSTTSIDFDEKYEQLLEYEILSNVYGVLEDNDRLVQAEIKRDKALDSFLTDLAGPDPEDLR